MEPTDITVEILKSIREEIRGLRHEVHGTNDRLDVTNARLEVQGRVLESHTQTLEVHGQAIVKLISEVHGLSDRFDNFLHGAHHEDHEDLRARVGHLEAKAG